MQLSLFVTLKHGLFVIFKGKQPQEKMASKI
jgi:hypothetical protein